MTHYKFYPAILLTLPACVLEKDLGDTEGLTGAAGTGDTGDSEPTTGASESTTGLPADCPEGQAHLAPLWQVEYVPPPASFGFYSGFSPVGRMADGRIVVAGNLNLADDQRGVTLVVTTPDGQLLGPQTAAHGDRGADVYALAIGADDQPVVLAEHGKLDEPSVMRLTRFASDMTLISQIDLPDLGEAQWPFGPALALADDGPVVAWLAADSDSSLVAKLAPDTGAPVWQQTLAGPPDMWVSKVAIGPAGDVAVAAHGDFGISPEDTLRLWRFDPAGAKIWDRVITVPEYEKLTALHFAPEDQIVVLRGTREFAVSVELLSVEVANGATRWELTVAEEEGKLDAWAQDMHVDADRFTIPVSRYQGHHDVMVYEHWLEVRTVSFAGELLDVTPLEGIFEPAGTSWARSVRGRCGELITLYEYSNPQFRAFAR